MSITVTNKYALGDGSGGGWPKTSSAFTPSNSSLLIAMATNITAFGTATNTWSCSGGSLTWTKRAEFLAADDGNGLCSTVVMYTAPVTTGASMTVQMSASGGTADGATISMSVTEVTGHDASPIGVSGTDGEGQLHTHSGTETVTLSGTTASASSVVFSVLVADGDTAESTIHAWPSESPTEIIAQVNGGWARCTHAYIAGSRSTAEWGSWSAPTYGGFAAAGLEIKASGGAPAAKLNTGLHHIEVGSPLGKKSNGILHPIRHGIVGWRRELILPDRSIKRVTHTRRAA